ncbi:hypothetical protein C8Q80DRAFT_1222624 [Daedaleopsis nitida]|nr:hypothetical protein C8Q80DRAFT_1222624 [Daedaleopsis nitida]
MSADSPAHGENPNLLLTRPETTALNGRFTFDVATGLEITYAHLKACATLFSENYGVWAPNAPAPFKPGNRVKMVPSVLRRQILSTSSPDDAILAMCRLGEEHVGHAFAVKWRYGDSDVVGWVTQLVVRADMRRQHIATDLLRRLKLHRWFANVTMLGVASSHPAACHAVCKIIDRTPKNLDLRFVAEHAAAVLRCSSVSYLKDAQVRGSLFDASVADGTVSSANTNFFVNHEEPNTILSHYLAENNWSLGNLLEGHEFIVLLPMKA